MGGGGGGSGGSVWKGVVRALGFFMSFSRKGIAVCGPHNIHPRSQDHAKRRRFGVGGRAGGGVGGRARIC